MKLHYGNRRQEGKEGHGLDEESRNLTDISRGVNIRSEPVLDPRV